MKALAIDMDDTLFNERDYVFSGYNAVAEVIASYNHLNKDEVYEQMAYQFFKYGRSVVFDYTKQYFKITKPSNEELLIIYRNHIPSIKLFDYVEESLISLRAKFKLGLVTDGNLVSQQNKVKALGLDKLIDEVVYCAEYNAPKPSAISYLELAKRFKINTNDMAIIGDDPFSDMLAAANIGTASYRVISGKYMSIKSRKDALPLAEFDSFMAASKYIIGD